MREKQEILDLSNIKLKDAGAALADERRRLGELQAKASEKDELQQKIHNLQRSAADLREQLARSNGQMRDGRGIMDDVTVGEADRGLDLDGQLAAIEQLFPHGDSGPHLSLSQEQMAFLSSLERAEVLGGRVKAYQQHNEEVENRTRELKSQSSELEERYKKIVSLCTKVQVSSVDEVLDSLLQAVVSEQKENVELGRVRDFLRMVQGTG